MSLKGYKKFCTSSDVSKNNGDYLVCICWDKRNSKNKNVAATVKIFGANSLWPWEFRDVNFKKNKKVFVNEVFTEKIKTLKVSKVFISRLPSPFNNHQSFLFHLAKNKYLLLNSGFFTGLYNFTTKYDCIQKFFTVHSGTQGMNTYAIGEKFVYDLSKDFENYLPIQKLKKKQLTKNNVEKLFDLRFKNRFDRHKYDLKTHKKLIY